ncbi:helix-turn-helix domain-containing protein [Kitasatospora sp. NPDC036755]|uniref:helix-turn-helix domain-containing protein n=1 Tax=Kitasatospora sp. NPDC036755 TaxID=3154600 RepID=UPI0033E89CF4
MNEPTQHAATPPPADDAPFLTVAEAAVVMQVTKMTVYRLVHAGDLPSIRTGRSFRIPSQALLDYLNAPGITRARA